MRNLSYYLLRNDDIPKNILKEKFTLNDIFKNINHELQTILNELFNNDYGYKFKRIKQFLKNLHDLLKCIKTNDTFDINKCFRITFDQDNTIITRLAAILKNNTKVTTLYHVIAHTYAFLLTNDTLSKNQKKQLLTLVENGLLCTFPNSENLNLHLEIIRYLILKDAQKMKLFYEKDTNSVTTVLKSIALILFPETADLSITYYQCSSSEIEYIKFLYTIGFNLSKIKIYNIYQLNNIPINISNSYLKSILESSQNDPDAHNLSYIINIIKHPNIDISLYKTLLNNKTLCDLIINYTNKFSDEKNFEILTTSITDKIPSTIDLNLYEKLEIFYSSYLYKKLKQNKTRPVIFLLSKISLIKTYIATFLNSKNCYISYSNKKKIYTHQLEELVDLLQTFPNVFMEELLSFFYLLIENITLINISSSIPQILKTTIIADHLTIFQKLLPYINHITFVELQNFLAFLNPDKIEKKFHKQLKLLITDTINNLMKSNFTLDLNITTYLLELIIKLKIKIKSENDLINMYTKYFINDLNILYTANVLTTITPEVAQKFINKVNQQNELDKVLSVYLEKGFPDVVKELNKAIKLLNIPLNDSLINHMITELTYKHNSENHFKNLIKNIKETLFCNAKRLNVSKDNNALLKTIQNLHKKENNLEIKADLEQIIKILVTQNPVLNNLFEEEQ